MPKNAVIYVVIVKLLRTKVVTGQFFCFFFLKKVTLKKQRLEIKMLNFLIVLHTNVTKEFLEVFLKKTL